MTESQRAWIYRVSLAVVTVLIVYGVVSEEQAAAWAGVALALTGNGLAALNTSTKGDTP